MDFLDPKKKRAHRTRLYIGYGLMAIAVAIATFILVFAAYGYDIDRRTGGVIQNGLIIIDAHPESASIYINQENMGTTSDRLVLPAGVYGVRLERNGYRNWTHQINLEGSTVEQLAYPFLFPEKLVTKSLQQYTGPPSLASTSPDRHWLVTQSPGPGGTFSVVDLNSSKNPIVTTTLPPGIITAAEGEHTYEAVEWSTDNVHLLIKHNFSGGQEFIILDRENLPASLNLNKTFPAQPFTAVNLRDKKAGLLYLFNAPTGTVVSADTSAKTATPVLSGVLSYKSYQADTLLYVTASAANPETAELYMSQNGDKHLLKTLPTAPQYLLDMAQFNGNFYVAAGSTKDGHVFVYKNPADDFNHRPARTPQPFRVLIVPSAEYVSFSGIARFIAVQGAGKFAVYDIETDRQFRYDTKLQLADHQKAVWMDGHRLCLISQGNITIFDFDGTNMQTLGAALPAFNPFFDRDYTALFTLAPTAGAPDKITLQRTELKVLPNSNKP